MSEKPFLDQRFLHAVLQRQSIANRFPGHIVGARGRRQRANIKGAFRIPVGRRAGNAARRSHGRLLSAGHAVVKVVDEHGGQIHVAPRGMDQVVSADRRAVAIAHQSHDMKIGVGRLDSRGIG